MTHTLRPLVVTLLAAGVVSTTVAGQEGFKIRSGVELVNVTATVTGRDGRFVPGLRKEDFIVYDEGERQEITHFSADRIPVSLGILLDSSGSMTEDKMTSARGAISRFIRDLLSEEDELFFMEFSDRAHLRQDWTRDRDAINRAVRRVAPRGGTALYDAIAEALPIAAAGEHRKKALLVISDGNDSDSRINVSELRQAIRESEVLVYALGVDGVSSSSQQPQPRITRPPRRPFPIPGIGGVPTFPQLVFGNQSGNQGERVNADALRQITDDTGGRTEVIRAFSDLSNATARIADELSQQYSLAYPSPGERDGRWRSIRVEVRDRSLTVRARRGYVSS